MLNLSRLGYKISRDFYNWAAEEEKLGMGENLGIFTPDKV